MSRYLLRSRDVYHDGTGWTPDVEKAKHFDHDSARTLASELANAGVISFIVGPFEIARGDVVGVPQHMRISGAVTALNEIYEECLRQGMKCDPVTSRLVDILNFIRGRDVPVGSFSIEKEDEQLTDAGRLLLTAGGVS